MKVENALVFTFNFSKSCMRIYLGKYYFVINYGSNSEQTMIYNYKRKYDLS